jgi:hypothetical protein
MQTLPTTTPQRTLPIKSFVVYLVDGRTIQVFVGEGDGFFRQQTIRGSEKIISTNECFIANGRWRVLPRFGKEVKPEPEEPEEVKEEPSEE